MLKHQIVKILYKLNHKQRVVYKTKISIQYQSAIGGLTHKLLYMYKLFIFIDMEQTLTFIVLQYVPCT